MANDWIIDVLSDLKAFAEKNGLVALERQLGITQATAQAELTSGTGMTGMNYDGPGRLHRGNAEGPIL